MTFEQVTYEHVVDCVGSVVCVAFIVHWVRQRRDPLRGAPLRTNRLDPLVVAWLLLFYLAMNGVLGFFAGAELTPDTEKPSPRMLVRMAAIQPVTFLVGGAACLLVGRHAFRAGVRGMGIGRRSVASDLVFAIVAYVAIWPGFRGLHVLSVLVLKWLDPGTEPPAHTVIEILHQPEHATLVKAWLVFGAAVAAPFGEELFFRGCVQTLLKRYLRSRWGAVVCTGVVFGLIHCAQPQAVLPLALLGCALGFAYERTGSLVCPMLLHAIFNGVTLAYQMAEG